MEKHIPIRQCTACRTKHEKSALLRVVRSPEGSVCLDERGKLSGRGVYLCTEPACLKRVVKSRGIERALGVPLPPEVREALEARVRKEGGDG